MTHFPIDNLAPAVFGAGFYSLFTAYGYISDRTYDPGYNIIYLVRFFLGIVAGTVLVTAGGWGPLKSFDSTILGLVGGYSADAVNQILLRISEVLVAAVKGTGKDNTGQDAAARAVAKEQQAQQTAETAKHMSDMLSAAAKAGAPNNVLDIIKSTMDKVQK